MPITFEELSGSPTIRIGTSGTEARREFRVAWDDWPAFAETLIGGWRSVGGTLQRVEPMPFPGLPGVVVEGLEVAPMDEDADRDAVQAIDRGVNAYPAGAKVSATYRSRGEPGQEATGVTLPVVEPGTVLSYRADLAVEYLTLPARAFAWSVTGTPKLPADVHPGVVLATGGHTLTWDAVASPPWTAIRDLRGKVNDATFLDAAAGDVLFLGARARRQFELLQTAGLWTIEYTFAERSVGWNSFFRDATSAWTAIEDSGGDPLYDEGDFAELFEFEN